MKTPEGEVFTISGQDARLWARDFDELLPVANSPREADRLMRRVENGGASRFLIQGGWNRKDLRDWSEALFFYPSTETTRAYVVQRRAIADWRGTWAAWFRVTRRMEEILLRAAGSGNELALTGGVPRGPAALACALALAGGLALRATRSRKERDEPQ